MLKTNASNVNSAQLPQVTFATLPSAVGNSGVQYLVTDAAFDAPGIVVISNNVRWKPLNGRARLKTLTAPQTLTNVNTIYLQFHAPAALFLTGDLLEATATGEKSGTTNTATQHLYIGTAGTTADADILNGVSAIGTTGQGFGGTRAILLKSATSAQAIGGTGGCGSYSTTGLTGSPLAAVTIPNVSNSLFVSMSMPLNGATDTIALESAYIDWVTP